MSQVFTLNVHAVSGSGDKKRIRSSGLNLVDLAGSERQKDTKARGAQVVHSNNNHDSRRTG